MGPSWPEHCDLKEAICDEPSPTHSDFASPNQHGIVVPATHGFVGFEGPAQDLQARRFVGRTSGAGYPALEPVRPGARVLSGTPQNPRCAGSMRAALRTPRIDSWAAHRCGFVQGTCTSPGRRAAQSRPTEREPQGPEERKRSCAPALQRFRLEYPSMCRNRTWNKGAEVCDQSADCPGCGLPNDPIEERERS